MNTTRITRWAASAAIGAALSLFPALASTAGAATHCTSPCAEQQIAVPSGYNLAVAGQQNVPHTQIIAQAASSANTGQYFTVTKVKGLPVKLYYNGDSTAVWASPTSITLSPGSASGTSAQVQVLGVHGTQAPASAPTFASTPAASAGDPRWVLEFHNGCYLFGDGTADHWAENPGGTQDTTYAAALTWAKACGSDNYLTSAFIVDDAGNAGHSNTLTSIQYGGQNPNEYLGDYQIGYTPGGGTAANCIGVGAASGDNALLFPCTDARTYFVGAVGTDSHTVFEVAASPNLALNDAGYGKNGSHIVAYAASASYQNENIWPGVHGVS